MFAAFRRSAVGDDGLSGGDGRAGNAGAGAGNEQKRQGEAGPLGDGGQVRADAEQGVEHHRPRQADQQDRPSADAIRDAAPDRRENKLHEREDGQE